MSFFTNHRRRLHNGRHMHTITASRICECIGQRLRDKRTPQQCARCGSRIDRRYDDEIDPNATPSLVIELPEEDWAYPGAEQD